MSRDKQTEIANDLNMHCVSLSEQFCGEMSCNACISNWLYNAGYRKSSEVAEEIFAEIEKRIASLEYQANTQRKTISVEELKAQVNWILHEVVPQTLAELKKKYTKEE